MALLRNRSLRLQKKLIHHADQRHQRCASGGCKQNRLQRVVPDRARRVVGGVLCLVQQLPGAVAHVVKRFVGEAPGRRDGVIGGVQSLLGKVAGMFHSLMVKHGIS